MYCTNIQGSALYDVTLGDEDLINDLYEKAKKEQSAKLKPVDEPNVKRHKPRRGYSREVEVLQDLVDNVIAFRAEAGKWKASSVKYSARPQFPADAVRELMTARARARRDAAIVKAKSHWRSANDVAS